MEINRMVYKIMLTLFTKGQAATPASNAGRFPAATSPAAASSADAATTEGENSAIFTSAKDTATRVHYNHKGTMLGFLLSWMPCQGIGRGRAWAAHVPG